MRLVFFGTPDIAVPAFRALCGSGHEMAAAFTQPDRPAGRGRKLMRCSVAAAADELGVPVYQPGHVRLALEELAALKPRAAAVMAYGQILPAQVLNAFPLGCVNLHTSLLPALRGASPINAAILRGFDETGVSTMFMDRGMDTGDVILQEQTAIGPQETAGGLADRLALLGAETLTRTMDLLEQGAAPRLPQDETLASHAPLLKKSDGLADWSRSADELNLHVRGMDPWPSAFTHIEDKQLKLFAPVLSDNTFDGADQGTVIKPRLGREDLLWVAAGTGALGVGTLQLQGKKKMPAADCMRGARLEPGLKLGRP